MAKPKVMILKEHGTNCEHESQFAFEKAGGLVDIVHMEDLIKDKGKLLDYQILMLPGGFSYGDNLGSGRNWANRIKNNLWYELIDFIGKDTLMLGVCNGFQTIVNLGLLPGLSGNKIKEEYKQEVSLVHNDSARYIDRWAELEFQGNSPWTEGLGKMSLPIAHGEGKFYADKEILKTLNEKGLIGVKYIDNPNGSLDNIAGITNETGRLFGLMPHPERAIDFRHNPNWTLLKEKYRRESKVIPKEGDGLKLFKNAVRYFK